MRKHRRVTVAILMLALFATGCKKDPAEAGPTDNELESRLATELPAYISIAKFRVEASENVGDKVDPLFKSRFRAVIRLEADTFLESSREESAIIVAPHLKSGEERELFGKAISRLRAGAWRVHFELENNPVPDMGKPRDFFSGGQVLIRGSSEEAAFREAQDRAQAEFARAAAESARAAASQLDAILRAAGVRELVGEAAGGGQVWPMRVRISSYNPTSKRVSGQVEWPTLYSIHRIEGQVTGTELSFEEVDYIKQGNASLYCVYTFKAVSSSSLEGTYSKCSSGVANLALQ